MTRFTFATCNAKHHWRNPGGRLRMMVQAHLDRGVDVITVNEADHAGYWELRQMPGVGVHRGSSNGGRKRWTGNLIVWRTDRLTLVRAGQYRARFIYLAGRRWQEKRPRLATTYSPHVVFRVRGARRLIRVRCIHNPTKFNARSLTRRRLVWGQAAWLRRRLVATVLAGDANDRVPYRERGDVQKLGGHGVDVIYGNRHWRASRSGVADYKRADLSDHDSPWVECLLRPKRRPRVPTVTAAGLLTTALRFVLTPPKEKP